MVDAPKKKFEPSGNAESTVDFDDKVRELKKFDSSTEGGSSPTSPACYTNFRFIDPNDFDPKREPDSERHSFGVSGNFGRLETPAPPPPPTSRPILTVSMSTGVIPAPT